MKKYKQPLVSVVIPTFNRPHYFKQALESALNQTYRNIEVVVSDNSTNDETENLVKKYFSKDKRVKYFHHKDFSADDNFNWVRHYDNPKAEYVNFLMDDDLFYPEKISRMIEIYLNKQGISLVTSRRNFIDENSKIVYKLFKVVNQTCKVPREIAARLLFQNHQRLLLKFKEPDDYLLGEFTNDNYIGGLTDVLIRKKFLRGNDLCWFDDEKGFYPLADVSTWLQLLTKGDMYWIDEPLSSTRLHSAQATHLFGNKAAVAIYWAKLIKYCWENKIFLDVESETRLAFFNWINIAVNSFSAVPNPNYYEEETALEDLNIAMAEALHNGCQINFPPSVQVILKNL